MGTPARIIVHPSDGDQEPESPEDNRPDPEPPSIPTPEIGPQYAEFHLRDGSIIGGEIRTDSIDIKTKFGDLNVPINRIIRVYPGLNHRPETREKVSRLIEELGAADSKTREAAQQQLIAMGPAIHFLLGETSTQTNAEQKKRLEQIQATLLQQMENDDDFGDHQMINQDTIVTPDFSIVGDIQQPRFHVTSKFGELNVQLGDIELADRRSKDFKQAMRKTVSVPAMTFFQKSPISTNLKVKKGDKIKINATGTVQWVNWNTSSTPEGLTNRSQWNGIHSGKLTARIGTDNRHCVAIGNQHEFVAPASGTIYLGIAMRDNYANNASYSWTGTYQAKIKVDPK